MPNSWTFTVLLQRIAELMSDLSHKGKVRPFDVLFDPLQAMELNDEITTILATYGIFLAQRFVD